MKQKYTIVRDEDKGGLTIQEHAELSKDLFSMICEESYDGETIQNAIGESKQHLIDTLRTPNLYPISEYIDRIADAVMALYDTGAGGEAGPVELIFDDVELFRKEEASEELVSEESVEIEDLLEDDTDQNAVEEPGAGTPDSSLDISIDTSDDASHESPEDTNSLS